MIKIVSFKICPFVQRVTALLEAKQLPYELEYIDLNDKPQWFLDLSPTGQVPMLITESNTALFESDAIMEYLDEISAPLEDGISPEQRALDRAWSYLASKHYLAQCSTMRSADQPTFLQRKDALGSAFEKVEAKLGDGRFFKGDSLSNVDIAWLPLLHRAGIILDHTGVDLLEGFPKTQAWQQQLSETGITEQSVSDDFEAVFTGFYLSSATFLGGNVKTPDVKESLPRASGCC